MAMHYFYWGSIENLILWLLAIPLLRAAPVSAAAGPEFDEPPTPGSVNAFEKGHASTAGLAGIPPGAAGRARLGET